MSNLNHACVRILIDDKSPRSPKGAGFLIAPNLVITCAHVVAEVLKIAETTVEKPTQTLFLDFPFVEQQPLQTAIVEAWYPVKNQPRMGDIEDLALLRLSENVTTQPFTLVDLAVYLNRAVHLTGFPKTKDEGIYLQGKLREITGEGRVQIDTEQGRGSVAGGFSGSAVYDMQENGVVGIVVSIDTYGGDVRGYMIPATTLLKAFPQLDELSRSLNPYKNLFAFTEDDVEFFFGREQATEELYTEVNHKPFITALGASGSGKSSLVLAGLIPRLKQQHWQILSLRLKREPFKNLALTLIPFLESDKITQAKKLDELSQDLETNKVKLSNLLSLAVKSPCLLFIDQFEELFTNNDTQTQKRFLSCLLELLTASPSDIKLLITLRADFMGQCLAFDNLAHVLKQNPPYLLTAMQQNELKAAISKPAAKLGVQFEKGLVEQLLREVGTEAGRLPLLQFTLTKLWEKQARRQISFDAYQQLGGLEKSLVQYADEVWQSFQHDEKQQNRLRYALVQLVRPGLGTEDTRQVALRSDMEQNWDLMQALADKRLVVTGGDETSQTVEIVHEVLIKHWGRMQEWLREDRVFRVWQNNLRDDIKDWQKNQDTGSLLRGVKLAEADANLKKYVDILNPNERDFIQESLNVANKERVEKIRLQRRAIKWLSGGLTVAIIATGLATWQWQRSEILRLATQAEALGSTAVQQFESGRQIEALLLAMQSGLILKELIEDSSSLNNHYPAVSPLFALQTILDGINERNRLEYQGESEIVLNGQYVSRVSLSSDGKYIVRNPEHGLEEHWDISGKLIDPTVQLNSNATPNIEPSTITECVVPLGGDQAIRLRYLPDQPLEQKVNEQIAQLAGQSEGILSIRCSPNGKYIVTTGRDGTVRLLNLSKKSIAQIIGRQGGVTDIRFSSDGQNFATLQSSWGNVLFWDLSKSQMAEHMTVLNGNQDSVTAISFSHDGKYVATAGSNGTINLWDSSGNKIRSEINIGQGIRGIKFNRDGKQIVIVTDQGIQILDLTGKPIQTVLKMPENQSFSAISMSFSQDDNYIAIAIAGGSVELRKITGEQLPGNFVGHRGWIMGVSFSMDGKFIATAGADDTIRLWNLSGEQIKEIHARQGQVMSVSFSPDGQFVASAGDDGTIRLWNLQSKEERAKFSGHQGKVLGVSFSPDGNFLASAGTDGTIRLWTLSGEQIAQYIGYSHGFSSETTGGTFGSLGMTFSPDGRHIATADDYGGVRLWRIETLEELLNRGCEWLKDYLAAHPDAPKICR